MCIVFVIWAKIFYKSIMKFCSHCTFCCLHKIRLLWWDAMRSDGVGWVTGCCAVARHYLQCHLHFPQAVQISLFISCQSFKVVLCCICLSFFCFLFSLHLFHCIVRKLLLMYAVCTHRRIKSTKIGENKYNEKDK